MITTAVQQASQMVEIQGAPAPVPATSDEFRATFAASVGSPATTQKAVQTAAQAGVASAKPVLLAGFIAKTPSLAASGALEGALQPEVAGPDESEIEASAGTASLGTLRASSNSLLDDRVDGDVSADVSNDAAGSSLALAVQPGAAGALKISGPLPANLQATASSGLAASAEIAKAVQAAQSTDGAAVRSRKEQTVSYKEPNAPTTVVGATSAAGGSLQIAAAAVPVAQLDTTSVAQALYTSQAGTTDGGSIAQKGTKTGVLTSVLETSEGGSSVHGSPVRPIGNRDAVSAGPGPDAFASLQQGVSATAAVPKATADASNVAVPVATASRTAEPFARSGAIAAEVQVVASDGVSVARSIAATEATAAVAPAAIKAEPKPLTTTVQTKSVTAVSNVGAKVSASSIEATETAAVTQARVIAQPHSVSASRPQIASQPAASKTVATGAAQLAESEGKNSASIAATASPAAAAAIGPAITSQGEVRLTQQADAVAAGTPSAEASSRAGVLAAKEEKTKSVTAGSGDTDSTRSTAVQSVTGDVSNITANGAGNAAANVTANFAAVATNAAGRAASVAEAGIPFAQASAHVAAVPVHDVAVPAGSAVPARALGAVSAGSIAETGTAAAQIGEPHRTLLATPTTLEVGVQSGTQGWLRIRAEVGGPGEVNASLTAASSGAREALHSQLPALNAFLHNEQIAATATVADRGAGLAGGGQGGAALGSGGLGGDGANGSNASLLHGGGAQTGGGQRESAQPVTSVSDAVRSYDSLGGVSEGAGPLSGGTSSLEESGRWLNVRV